MILRILFFVLAAFMLLSQSYSQKVITDLSLKEDYQAQVKSLDEFQSRFNGVERKPGVNDENDNLNRRLNLINLFDFEMNKNGLNREQFKESLNTFVDSILIHAVYFDIQSSGIWTECKCRFKYKGKEKRIILILQRDKSSNGANRWAIVGVKGLDKAGIINTERLYSISPVEHEIYFLGLHYYLNVNPSHAFGYRATKKRIDQTSVFFALVQSESLKFELVEEQIIYCLDVPGYVFSIKEYSRKGQNSGWLINNPQKMDIHQKEQFIKKLVGYED